MFRKLFLLFLFQVENGEKFRLTTSMLSQIFHFSRFSFQWRVDITVSSWTLFHLFTPVPTSKMNAKSVINKEVFIPHDEKMLAAVQVKRRTKKKIPFLATGGQGDYMTFICLSGQTVNLICSLFLSCCCPELFFKHVCLNSGTNADSDRHGCISHTDKWHAP